MNVCEYLLEKKNGNAPALLTLSGTYTFDDLATASSRVAAFLAHSGGRKGDRVILLSDNGFFWTAAYLGTLRAGLVCVPLPSRIAGEDLAAIVSMTDPQFSFVESRALPAHAPVLQETIIVSDCSPSVPGISGLVGMQEVCSSRHANFVEPEDLSPDDLAALMFTSGSTGKPRGVMVSHENIIANTDSIIQYLSLTAADRILAVLPFHYCFGASLLHTHLRVGGSVVVEPRFMYPETVLDRMLETDCTGFAGVPSHYQILLRRSSVARRSFPRLRYMQQAGGHLAPTFVQELRSVLPGTAFFIMYGQTEATARLCYLPPDRLEAKLGSVGGPIPGVRVSILDAEGHEVKPGDIGELVAEGNNITLGYWNDPDATAKAFRNGKLHTGDLATIDEDGFIFIVDRANDFLKCGGKRVSCRWIEDVLLQCDLLVEAAVIGIPDEILGEAVKALVVLRDRGGDSLCPDVREFCRLHLPPFLVPKEIEVVSALPKNSAGKVMKQVLRQESRRSLVAT